MAEPDLGVRLPSLPRAPPARASGPVRLGLGASRWAGIGLVLLIPVGMLLWARSDLAAGRGVLETMARLAWWIAGAPPVSPAYQDWSLRAGLLLGTLGLLLSTSLRSRRPGIFLAMAGGLLGLLAFPSPWLWLLAVLPGLMWPDPEELQQDRRRFGPVGWWTVALLTLLAGLLRYAHIDRFPHGLAGHAADHVLHGQRMLAMILGGKYPSLFGEGPAGRLLRFLLVENDTFGLQHLIDWGTFRLLGWGFRNQRLVAAAIGLWTVLPTAALGTRLFGRRAGLAGAALLGISSWHATWCRYEGSIQILNPLHQAIGLWLLVWMLQGRWRWLRAVPVGLWFGGSCLLHASSHAFPAVLAGVVAAEAFRRSPGRRSRLAAGGLALSLAAGFYLVRLEALNWNMSLFLNTALPTGAEPGWAHPLRSLKALLDQLFVACLGMHIRYNPSHGLLDPALLLMAPLGLGMALRRVRRREGLILLLAVGAAVLPALISPQPAPRRLINLLVPACLLAGLAWDRLSRLLGPAGAPVGILALVGALVVQTGLHFGGVQAFETELSYHSVVAAELAGPLLESHCVVVVRDSAERYPLNENHFQAVNRPILDRVGEERLLVLSLDQVEERLLHGPPFPAPPVLIMKRNPSLTTRLMRLPDARIRAVSRRWETPRAPVIELILVELHPVAR